jgi:hypothetical protein
MTFNHPPIANKVACIDFDGTIVPWGPLMAPKDPFPGVPDQIRALKAAGYSIVIFTSRFSPTWQEAQDIDPMGQYQYIVDTLHAHDIPYDHITAEKIPAEVYFDDKAIQVSADYPLDHAILDFLLREAA